MTTRAMGKRLQTMEDRLAPPEYDDVRLFASGPETDRMIAESRARGENVFFLVMRPLRADD